MPIHVGIRAAIVAGLVLIAAQSYADDSPTREEETVREIVTELETAVATGNKEAWKKHMATDGILINRDGKTYNKEELVREINPKPAGVDLRIVPVNMKMYVKENSAFVSFLADETLSIFGQRVDTKYPSVMYFDKRNGEWQMVFFSYFELPVNPPQVAVSKEYLEKFAGTYEVSDKMRITVRATDSTLVYTKEGGNGTETVLYPIDKDGRFFRHGTESEFIFTNNESGSPVVLQRRNWIDLTWYKKK